MTQVHYKAAILDLDGVITQTAAVHARAWKEMFDEFFEERVRRENEDYRPFDIDVDYRRYVDGKPRYDGVRSFLQHRNIDLPRGEPDDPPTKETICGLGNRKNEIFGELLKEEGVAVFDDAVEQIGRWRKADVKLAVVSSSRNCAAVLEAAGLADLFETRVDGVVSARLNLKGKPAPDIFLEAAKRLNVSPQEAIVVEDAQAGVEAGRAGGFALVVGVARKSDDAPALEQHGADIVVGDLRHIDSTVAQLP